MAMELAMVKYSVEPEFAQLLLILRCSYIVSNMTCMWGHCLIVTVNNTISIMSDLVLPKIFIKWAVIVCCHFVMPS